MTALEQTTDEGVWVVDRAPGRVEYLDLNGNRWRIYGTCNKCGECWKGITLDVPPDLDCPVRPEISQKIPECVLTGEYL